MGASYVITNILIVPRLGTDTVLRYIYTQHLPRISSSNKKNSVSVCAQIITACVIDHFALVGVTKRTYSIWQLLASLGLVGCVVVIAKFKVKCARVARPIFLKKKVTSSNTAYIEI